MGGLVFLLGYVVGFCVVERCSDIEEVVELVGGMGCDDDGGLGGLNEMPARL